VAGMWRIEKAYILLAAKQGDKRSLGICKLTHDNIKMDNKNKI
jgi:hypothetical protein